jgi:aminopeptidase N
MAIGLVALMAAFVNQALAADRIVLPANVVPLHYDLSVATDAAHLTFMGTVGIDVDVQEATRSITMNAADLTFSRVRVDGISDEPRVSFDSKTETVTLTLASELTPGKHRFTIDYTGTIFDHAAGLFALDYKAGKTSKRALFTQFENSDARRFLPCWDEPNRKATFSLTVTVPEHDLAVSNTPVAKSERAGSGLKRVHFATTPRMSSYLLFLATGDLERVSRRSGKVDVGIVVKRGERAKAKYALDAAVKILPFLEDYFGVDYPLPKLDFIAGPGSSQFFGAMENWGAIFYFERAILVDSKTTTENDRRRIFNVIAHEMAHQWFGDLVTMDWWDDLWLNEGYATWMASKVSNHFHPEWRIPLDMIDTRDRAMSRDAREGTHPVIQHIRDVLQASQAFDAITYQKGGAVIRMLEDFVGADVFRKGVRNYMVAHAYGNAVTDDLWRELDMVSTTRVSDIAHDFTLQDGVPLIVVQPSGNGLQLVQGRFAMDASRDGAHEWRVPVIAAHPSGGAPWRGVVAGRDGVQVPLDGARGLILNSGQSGYYNVLYDDTTFARLVQQFPRLRAEDQLGLIYNTRMLAYAGDMPLSRFLELVSHATPEMSPRVLTVVAQRLEDLGKLYRGVEGEAAYRAYATGVLKPLCAKVGWSARRGEDANQPLLRAALLQALSVLGDEDTIREARKRFTRFLAHPERLTAEERRIVLEIAARRADERTWEQLHHLAQTTRTSVDRDRYYTLLASSYDPALVQRAMALALTNEPPATTRPTMVRTAAERFPAEAFDFALAHHDAVVSWLEPTTQNRFFPALVDQGMDEALIKRLNDYAEKYIPDTARQSVKASVSQIALNSSVRAKRLPEATAWLAARDKP